MISNQILEGPLNIEKKDIVLFSTAALYKILAWNINAEYHRVLFYSCLSILEMPNNVVLKHMPHGTFTIHQQSYNHIVNRVQC